MFAYKMLKDPQWKQWAIGQGAGMSEETQAVFIRSNHSSRHRRSRKSRHKSRRQI